jgi:hypothetical protein
MFVYSAQHMVGAALAALDGVMEMLRITRGRAAVNLLRPHVAMSRANIINGVALTP